MGYNQAEALMHLDNGVWDEFGFGSRPSGPDRIKYVVRVCEKLDEANYAPGDFPQEVLDMLENENYHSLLDAIEVFRGEQTLQQVEEHEREYYPHLF